MNQSWIPRDWGSPRTSHHDGMNALQQPPATPGGMAVTPAKTRPKNCPTR
jgi:hypothetical protein